VTTPLPGPPRRTLLGTAADLGSRHRVYETAEAVELDEASGFTVLRHRVFYDEVILVTQHALVGWPLAVALGALALLVGGMAGVMAMGDALWGAVGVGAVALLLAALTVMRIAIKMEAVTVYGKRSRVQVSFWLRRRKARAVFSRLCARVLQAQSSAAQRPPEPGPALPPSFSPPGPEVA